MSKDRNGISESSQSRNDQKVKEKAGTEWFH